MPNIVLSLWTYIIMSKYYKCNIRKNKNLSEINLITIMTNVIIEA